LKKVGLWGAFAGLLVAFAAIQFVPDKPVVVPATLPPGEREQHRLLEFEGVANFRDLGGYATSDGRRVRWGRLYRSGNFAAATSADQRALNGLGLVNLIDFRSEFEKAEEPNRLLDPVEFEITEIPILDAGNQAMVEQLTARIESGDFGDFDPDAFMLTANAEFTSKYTGQLAAFMQEILDADGAPVVWHCTAGKDRTGIAAALLLRILGVPQATVVDDYMLSKDQALQARRFDLFMLDLFKGQEAADKVRLLLGVEERWLAAAFARIDQDWGDFDSYRRQGLGVSDDEVARLQAALLE
jgi:protein-tyrosine phosphatase